VKPEFDKVMGFKSWAAVADDRIGDHPTNRQAGSHALRGDHQGATSELCIKANAHMTHTRLIGYILLSSLSSPVASSILAQPEFSVLTGEDCKIVLPG
jgi:hypothetical protein